ncbi:DUF3040 domain-containing protein [Pseudonocardia nigra]|uniref:DUF3040 domain-containing protein n=1 Tax=Pseudonocardia nigra TaxID=1921578 RepID=UPI003557EB49
MNVYERRRLEAIERELQAEDPSLAHPSVRRSRSPSCARSPAFRRRFHRGLRVSGRRATVPG